MATKYLYIDVTDTLAEIIPDFDPAIPDTPVSERYSAEFLSSCVERTDEQIASEGIKVGMHYDKESDTFSEPVVPEPVPEQYIITEAEIKDAYEEGVNNVE